MGVALIKPLFEPLQVEIYQPSIIILVFGCEIIKPILLIKGKGITISINCKFILHSRYYD